MAKKKIIRAKVLYDGEKKYENKTIIIEGSKITDIVSKKMKADYEGYVTPAFIDAHSHIGMDREGEPWTESETNDTLSQILPNNDPLNSIYFDDRAFKDSVDFGILYSCVVPGSGNLIGGRARIIKNFAKSRKDALLKDYGFKMALGFNPRSTTEWKGERPNTRMGVYALLEKKFDDLLIKEEKEEIKKIKAVNALNRKRDEGKIDKKDFDEEMALAEKEYKLAFTAEEKGLLELLSGNKTAKIHVHKDDDVMYLIDFVKKYKIRATADHTGDVFNKSTFNELARNNIPIVYGPLGSVGYKVELKHAYYQNAGILMQSNAQYGLMTDHPVIHTMCLRDSLKFFLIEGMKAEEAIGIITKKNAEILGIDDQLGSIKKGMTASILIWDRNPLNLGAFPRTVIAEGRKL